MFTICQFKKNTHYNNVVKELVRKIIFNILLPHFFSDKRVLKRIKFCEKMFFLRIFWKFSKILRKLFSPQSTLPLSPISQNRNFLPDFKSIHFKSLTIGHFQNLTFITH